MKRPRNLRRSLGSLSIGAGLLLIAIYLVPTVYGTVMSHLALAQFRAAGARQPPLGQRPHPRLPALARRLLPCPRSHPPRPQSRHRSPHPRRHRRPHPQPRSRPHPRNLPPRPLRQHSHHRPPRRLLPRPKRPHRRRHNRSSPSQPDRQISRPQHQNCSPLRHLRPQPNGRLNSHPYHLLPLLLRRISPAAIHRAGIPHHTQLERQPKFSHPRSRRIT